MIGQHLTNAKRVTVLIETDDGQYHGWQVINPTSAAWKHLGTPGGSTHAEVRVAGEFHRKRKDDAAFQLSERMAEELDAGYELELGRGDEGT